MTGLSSIMPRRFRCEVPAGQFGVNTAGQITIDFRKAMERMRRVRAGISPHDSAQRAVIDSETEGFARIHTKRGSGRILGATIVARHAGEMINEITLAVTAGTGLSTVAKTIHPYPTQAEAVKKAADQYNKARLTPFIKKCLLHG